MDVSYAISRNSDGKPLCDEAGRSEMEAEALRLRMDDLPEGMERDILNRHRDHALNAAATSHKAHNLRVCSCFVRIAMNADRKRRGLEPL